MTFKIKFMAIDYLKEALHLKELYIDLQWKILLGDRI